MNFNFKRGDIFYADFGEGIGSEQGGIRPVVIVQNNVGNKFSPTLIVSPLTSKMTKAKLPTHVMIRVSESGLPKDSVALTEQVRVLDKSRIKSYVNSLPEDILDELDEALEVSVGLTKRSELKAKQLTSEIKIIDILIEKCMKLFGGNINSIKEELKEREIKVNELETYCKTKRLNINNYYSIDDTRIAL